MTSPSSSPAPRLDFGHHHLLDRLEQRLRDSLRPGLPPSLEPALVAGVFGEWGSGKSHLLAAVGQRVRAWPAEAKALHVVVEFNAWRYEREEHLLVPLLKVAQQALEKALEAQLENSPELDEVRRRELWKDRVGLLADLASSLDARGIRAALNMGFKVFGVPLSLPERSSTADAAKAAPESITREIRRRTGQRRAERRTRLPMQALESLYFDFLEHLKAVTGRNPAYLRKHRERLAQGWVFDNPPAELTVNLVFLVDDLDRCLPDKAVEVLEAIKLFLEVPGCAFVLALDEEVVERGIAHRYRDYALQGQAQLTPITGAEYLEKLVHLPIRLPRPSRVAARKHLADRAPDWFRGRDGLSNPLAEWVAALTPPVPRKLHRMADLLQLADSTLVGQKLELPADTRRHWLALVCALQLFAPALFRYLRLHGPALLLELVDWRSRNELRDLDALRSRLLAERKQAELTALPLQRKLERLPDMLDAVLHNRSGFDLLEVLGLAAELRRTHPLDVAAQEPGQSGQKTAKEETTLGALLSFVLLAEAEQPPEGWVVEPDAPPPVQDEKTAGGLIEPLPDAASDVSADAPADTPADDTAPPLAPRPPPPPPRLHPAALCPAGECFCAGRGGARWRRAGAAQPAVAGRRQPAGPAAAR